MLKRNILKVNPYVFFISAFLIIVFVVIGASFPKETEKLFTDIQHFICAKFGWLYMLSVAFFLVFVIWLLFSRYGSIKLGDDDEEPEYSRLTWFAMLFSAGMGIGLLFYSVAEPMLLFQNPPDGDVEGRSAEAAMEAMRYTFFHWGLHAWGIYIVIGLALSYFTYRHKLPLSIRSALYPILGEKIHGFWGNMVEIMAVLGTLFGVATSLGLGVMQVNTGLDHLNIFSNTTGHQIMLIIGITLVATMSVVSGVDKGVRRLSEMNLMLAMLLLVFVFIMGPTSFIMQALVNNTGNYFQTLIGTTFDTHIFKGTAFQRDWTLFYWGWWIAWSPFVGMFIARISRGRTIREFIAGVLLVPSILTFTWLTVFGNTALHMELFGKGGMVKAVNSNIATSLFVMLEKLPLQQVSCFVAVVVIAFFFITSSDSASLVIDIITSGGKKNPPTWQKIFWASMEGIVAIILLLTGGLVALQTAVITTALPFCIIMIFMCYCLWKALRTETDIILSGKFVEGQNILLSSGSIAVTDNIAVETPISETFTPGDDSVLSALAENEMISEIISSNQETDWRKRFENLKSTPHKHQITQDDDEEDKVIKEANKRLRNFIQDTVAPAFKEIEKELIKLDRIVKVVISAHQASVIVYKNDIEELYYGIKSVAYHKFSYTFPALNTTDTNIKCYAQIFMRNGTGKFYELNKFTKDNIINDFLNEYQGWRI